MQRISCINRRHSSTIEASTPSLILHSAARAMISDMRATYSAQSASVSRSTFDDAPDCDLKSRRQSNPPSSSCTAAASTTNSSSSTSTSSSSSSRTPKRASQAQGQSHIQGASKWGGLDLSASSSASILTSSYDYDNGGDSGNGDDSGCDNGCGIQTSDSRNAAEGREGSSDSAFNKSESAESERHDNSEGNGESTNESKNEGDFVNRNPLGALEDSDIPLQEDFGEFIGGSSNSLFSPLQQKSLKSSVISKTLRAEFNQKKGVTDGIQGAGFQLDSHSEVKMIDETVNDEDSAGFHGSTREELGTELYDICDTDLLKIAVQSAVKKNKKSKRLFPATPDTDKKTKKRRKSEKDSIDDIFGDM
jgi:hypothetical protein